MKSAQVAMSHGALGSVLQLQMLYHHSSTITLHCRVMFHELSSPFMKSLARIVSKGSSAGATIRITWERRSRWTA